jgi:N-acetyl-anhydromuramyl-L-alanine amidase AmpD
MSNYIIVGDKTIDIGTKVVTWNSNNGFNGYDTSRVVIKSEDRRTGKETSKVIKGKRYGSRAILYPNNENLKKIIKQFFLHHSGLYRSRDTFNVLHNQRGLSVHFILDDDGTLYQTLNVSEKAFHGGICNKTSIGIEIDSRANARKYSNAYDKAHQRKYRVGSRHIVSDTIHGREYLGFDYSDAQYRTLIRLAVALVGYFPNILPTFPRRDGTISRSKTIISNPTSYRGLLCHYHVSKSKWDPVSLDHPRIEDGIFYNNPDQASSWKSTKFVLNIKSSLYNIQEALALLGYDPGPIDGICGPRTERALNNFRDDYNISTVVKDCCLWNRELIDALNEALNEAKEVELCW